MELIYGAGLWSMCHGYKEMPNMSSTTLSTTRQWWEFFIVQQYSAI